MSRQHLNRACKKGAPKPKKYDSVDLSPTFKSNFDEVVKNIVMESQKSNYNPETDMNWCNLPMEMKNECVKRMDFKTRCGFRGISKFEKSLVDSKKYKFKHLQIYFDNEVEGYGKNIWDIEAKSGNKESELHIRTKDRLNEKCLSAIFKHAEVKNFRLYAGFVFGCEVRPILKQLENIAPFPFKRVSVFGNRSTDFFMQTCPNLERIDMRRYLPYKKMLKLPSILKIKEFKLWNVSEWDLLDFLPGLVQKWIDNDAEVGKSVQFNYEIGGCVNMVAEKFADRIIEKTDNEVRIRINNEKTQILMRSLGSEKDPKGWEDRVSNLCSFKVIPIGIPKSEYKKGDEWIQAIYEQHNTLENPNKFGPEEDEIWRLL